MRIGLDISQIAHKGTGVARFTDGLVHAILDNNDRDQWKFFFSSLRGKLDPSLRDNIENKQLSLTTAKLPPTVLEFLWNKVHLVRMERFIGPIDWLITSDWAEPPSKAKKAAIVHDLVFMRMPETVHAKILKTQTARLKHIKKESSIIFADSRATKADLVEYANITPQRIIVNYPGVSVKRPTIDEVTRTQFRYKLHKPFILAVGKVEPRKNIKRLIEAFDMLHLSDFELIIAGPAGWQHIDKEYKNVRFLGYVNDNELMSLYSQAQMFVFPSLWEGFGYPPLEAMQIGCPVIMSQMGSLAEIGADTAYFVNPEETDSIAHGISTVLDNDELRLSLIEKGKEKSKKYTWKNYYNTLMRTLYDNSG